MYVLTDSLSGFILNFQICREKTTIDEIVVEFLDQDIL